ncbi:MAG: A/G-specific adenine glycosylase [Pseudomonadota bacterium]
MIQQANPGDLLEWYDANARALPWRMPPSRSRLGERTEPYRVWLSEIMLQQTTVAAVKSYFEAFTERWPTVQDLAAASEDEVLAAWAGLGYYSRARNLHKCARTVVDEYDGQFPDTAVELVKLPGIGAYTSAAIASIAFGEPVPVVDGNIERVISRIARIETPLPAAKAEIGAILAPMVPKDRPGDFAQALMDLGATICTPKRPACTICVWRDDCEATATDEPERFPIKAPKKPKSTRRGAAYIIRDGAGSIWLEKRTGRGLLAGMAQVPTTDWNSRQDGIADPSGSPIEAPYRKRGVARHTFTHFHLELEVYETVIDPSDIASPTDGGWWSPIATLSDEALPTLMVKAISVAMPDTFKGERAGVKAPVKRNAKTRKKPA